jgi:dihydrofolate reductase
VNSRSLPGARSNPAALVSSPNLRSEGIGLNNDAALDERGLTFRNELERVEMAALIYSAITSLDGYVEDEAGKFDWAAPDDEVHAFVNDLERPIGTYLYGRRMYETMVFWETVSTGVDQPAVIRDFAEIWRAAEKIVYSRTLQTASSARTRIERNFDADKIRRLKDTSGSDITIGGAELAGQAIRAGLVDQCHLFLTPIVVGRGKRALPDDVRTPLELLGERRFGNGVVYLHYCVSV